jgi:type II secretory pathway pseudopilin PulG
MTSAPKQGGIPRWVWIVVGLVVVLPILGVTCLVLAGAFMGFATFSQLREATDQVSRVRAESVGRAAQLYVAEHGACPTIDDLTRDRSVSIPDSTDPQGHPWTIECPEGGAITVRSPGMDGVPGNTDDVRVTM